MTTKASVQGVHIWFIRKGTAFTLLAPGTVSNTSVVDATDPVWSTSKLPITRDFDIDPGIGQLIEIDAPSPGLGQRAEVLQLGGKPVWTATFDQISELVTELFFQTLPLTSADEQFNPGERTAIVEGLIKLQTYDELGNPIWTIDSYAVLTPKGTLKLDMKAQTTWQIEIRPIWASINTGKQQ